LSPLKLKIFTSVKIYVLGGRGRGRGRGKEEEGWGGERRGRGKYLIV